MATTKDGNHETPVNIEEKQTRWTIEKGSAVVKIYLTPHNGSDYFTVSYWLHKKRKRQVFPTFEQAKEVATEKAKEIASGDVGAVQLTNADSAAYARAIALLEPVGAPLEFAASEYASAVKRLGTVSLSQAVDYYLQRHPTHLAPKMVREVVDELFKVKRSEKLSERYLKQIEYDLNRFATRFQCRISHVMGTQIDDWLRELEVGPRTRNNLRNSVQALFNFAISRRYLPKDHDELDAVAVAKDKGGEIEIFTPAEMAEVMSVASPEHIPFLAISAFAGVRHAEVQRLDWANVKKESNVIEIRAGTAKTASRRVIPLLPNLKAWLKPHWQDSGKICPYANMVLQFVELTRRVNEKRRAAWAAAEGVSADALKEAEKRAAERIAKLPRGERRSRRTVLPGADTAEDEGWTPFLWKHNALRHSFISYRVAQTQNVAQVALEAGNSPRMIFQHYRELVQRKDALKWFAISVDGEEKPKRGGNKAKVTEPGLNNVVPMPQEVAA
jgi:integrase